MYDHQRVRARHLNVLPNPLVRLRKQVASEGRDRISKSAEDYLETIYVLSREKGYARVLEIAKALNVRAPSVTQMLKKLRARGLVIYERYGVVRLTEEGMAIAMAILARHESLKSLLLALGVSEKTAEEDACAMEHVLHDESVQALKKIADFLTNAPAGLKCLRCIREGKHLCLSNK